MREILLTSSVLILALLALRRVFRQKISRRLQYALWGLVLVRLLVSNLRFAVMLRSRRITVYSGSEYVRCQAGDIVRWFRAENLTDPADAFYDRSDIFNSMRQWFDETERGSRSNEIVIPDDGRSREETALAWARAYEGRSLELTETNRYHCTYVDVRDVEIDTDYPREYYPRLIGDRDAFLISYSVVFVPDDWRYYMAGNTEEYEGGGAPEGAFRYWRIAYLYLDKDGWRSDGPGTGP